VGALVDVVKQHCANMSSGDLDRDREIMSPDVVTVDPNVALTGLSDPLRGDPRSPETAEPRAGTPRATPT
jgi:hypothetical protein